MKFDAKSADELHLDLLVDDELPETERRTVLQSLDATPVLWRDLAIRFMQRQVERKVIRQIIAQQNVVASPTRKPFVFGKSVNHLRIAAALLLTAGLAVGSVLLYNNSVGRPGTGASTPEQASFWLPAEPLTGAAGPDRSLSVPVTISQSKSDFDLNAMMPQSSGTGGASRHLVIMPNQNGAVVFPVTTVKDEVVY